MRLIVLAVCGYLAYYALGALLRWLLQPPREKASGELVRDPECGVYFSKEDAVTRRVGGSVELFCSERCAAARRAKSRG